MRVWSEVPFVALGGADSSRALVSGRRKAEARWAPGATADSALPRTAQGAPELAWAAPPSRRRLGCSAQHPGHFPPALQATAAPRGPNCCRLPWGRRTPVSLLSCCPLVCFHQQRLEARGSHRGLWEGTIVGESQHCVQLGTPGDDTPPSSAARPCVLPAAAAS